VALGHEGAVGVGQEQSQNKFEGGLGSKKGIWSNQEGSLSMGEKWWGGTSTLNMIATTNRRRENEKLSENTKLSSKGKTG